MVHRSEEVVDGLHDDAEEVAEGALAGGGGQEAQAQEAQEEQAGPATPGSERHFYALMA